MENPQTYRFEPADFPPGRGMWGEPGYEIEKVLQELIDTCEFIVTDYGSMYPSKGCTVIISNHGPAIWDGKGQDSWSKISGGYKRIQD